MIALYIADIATCCRHGWLVMGTSSHQVISASGELARDGVVRQVQGRVTVTTEHRGGRHELKGKIFKIFLKFYFSQLTRRSLNTDLRLGFYLPERSWRRAALGSILTCGRGGGACPLSPSCRPPCPRSSRWTWCPRRAGNPRTRNDASSWISVTTCGFGFGYCPF